MDILRKVDLTRKFSSFDSVGLYCFIVNKAANKPEIKKEIEKKYQVEVEDVNTMIYGVSRRVSNTKRGMRVGVVSSYKKAIVRLKKGSFINVL